MCDVKKDTTTKKKYPMITYKRRNKNKHGQYIAYWSKQKEIPRLKFRNFRPDNIE
jgi:hypothetical protein